MVVVLVVGVGGDLVKTQMIWLFLVSPGATWWRPNDHWLFLVHRAPENIQK